MYQVQSIRNLARAAGDARRGLKVSRNVLLLGLTSLFTDISAEMVATVLPLYLIYTLGLSPLQFGVVDGAYQGATALVRVAGGAVADRTRRYKEVAAVGYALSALSKPAFLVAGGALGALTALVLVDRAGKGIRTAPRDGLISLSSSPANLATSFGVHRALDTVGAMLGPLVAFGLLVILPTGFDAIFVVSFCFALIGLGILVLFVENLQPATAAGRPEMRSEAEANAQRVSLRAAADLVRERRFRRVVLVATALGLATMSDGFIYLGLQRHLELDPNVLPLLFVGTAFAYTLLAVPIGLLADRIGRARLFVAGYALLLLVYASLLLPTFGTVEVVVLLLLLGTYYAATDGVLMALASALIPASLIGTGLALVVTASSLARLLASVLFGALWMRYGVETAVSVFAAALVLAISFSVIMFALTRRRGRTTLLEGRAEQR